MITIARKGPMLILALAAAAAAPRAAQATPEADMARADIQKTIGFVPGMFKSWFRTSRCPARGKR